MVVFVTLELFPAQLCCLSLWAYFWSNFDPYLVHIWSILYRHFLLKITGLFLPNFHRFLRKVSIMSSIGNCPVWWAIWIICHRVDFLLTNFMEIFTCHIACEIVVFLDFCFLLARNFLPNSSRVKHNRDQKYTRSIFLVKKSTFAFSICQ